MNPEGQPKQLGAKIIGQDSSSESLGFFLNVGERDGVQPRMPVVTASGIVGSILRVYPSSSLFVAVADPAHNVDGIVNRSRARFVVEGLGHALRGRLKYLDRSEDVRVGDLVLTSGLDGVFPKGHPIGTIVRVKKPRSGVAQEAELRPIVDLGRLEEVVVLQ
jgi:rod shape-determining protein MreC